MASILSTNSVYWSPVTTYFELTATITQNITTNTSSIAYQLITRQTPTGSGYYRSINSCTVTINGTSNTAVAASTVSNGTVLQSGTVNVTHNDDGNKTVAVSVNVNVGGSTASGSTNYILDTIPRASELTVASDNIVISSTSGTVGYTVTPKANFYHKLELVFGSVTTPITIGQKSAAYSATVTYAQLLSTVTTATSGSVVFRLSTYSDSGYSTLVGTSSVAVPITITLKPTVAIGALTADNSAMRSPLGNTYFVAGYSKVNIAYAATNTSGSTGVTVYASVTLTSLTESSKTGTSGTFTTNLLPASTANHSNFKVSMYAVDSRGAQSDTAGKTLSLVYGYTPPTASLTAYRVLTSTSQQEDFTGNQAYVAWTTPVVTSVNSQNTIQSQTAAYSGSISGTVTNGGHFALTDSQSVTVTLTLADKITTTVITEDIGVVAMPLDLYQDIVNNEVEVGVAFGKEAWPNTTMSAMPILGPGSFEFIEGTWTAATNVWTGVSLDNELYDQKRILLKMPYNGNSSGATLNLTLADGTTTGAKNVYFEGTTRFTTHKSSSSLLDLIYFENRVISGTSYEGWWYIANRDTNDTAYYFRMHSIRLTTKTALYRYMICFINEYSIIPANAVSNSTATTKTLTTESFDPFADILYYSSTSTINANTRITENDNLYSSYYNITLGYSFNTGSTLTADRPVYLVCVPQSDGKVKLHTTPIAQTLPATNDGLVYKFLGMARSTSTMSLYIHKPCYWYKAGGIVEYKGGWSEESVITKSSGVATLTSSSTSVEGAVVTVTLVIAGTSASQSAGNNIFVGTLASKYAPPNNISAVTYYGSRLYIGLISSDGSVNVRAMDTGTTDTTMRFSWTFVQN